MTQVGSWQPGAAALSTATLQQLLAQVDTTALEAAADLALPAASQAQLAALMQLPKADWRAQAGQLDAASLVALIKLLTLAEMQLPGCKVGARSPVIALAAELKAREAWPNELLAWIRRHSDNRFLPYGSLLERL